MHNFFVLATGVLLYQAMFTSASTRKFTRRNSSTIWIVIKSRLANARCIHQGRHALQVLRWAKAGPAPDLVIFHHSFALENGPFIDDKNDAIYIEKEIHTTLYKKITIGH